MGILVVVLLLMLILVGIIIAAVITKDVFWILVTIIYGSFCVLILLNEIKLYRKDKGKKVNKVNYTAIIIYLAIASIFTTLCYALYQNQMLIKGSVKTTATVYNIEEKYDYDNAHKIKNKRCVVYYKYNVDEMEYKAVTEGCKYNISDEFTIYYSKTNPTKISKNRVVVLLIGILVSLIVLVVYLFQELKPIKHEETNPDIKIKKVKVKTKKKVKK